MARIIQVGLGNWGLSWARDVVPTVEAAEAVAFVDAVPAALERVQRELGVDTERCFTQVEAALDKVECDLVLATLRTEGHYPVVRLALEAGCNVIVEKPFASTMAEAQELVALAEANGRTLMVSQNYRYFPAPIVAAELVAAHTLGSLNLVSIDFRCHAPSVNYHFWDVPDPLIADMSIHHFDLMRMVLNDNPLRVSCRTWNVPHSRFVHDPIAALTVEFTGGTMVSYRGSWLSGGTPTPWAGEWVMDFADGDIAWTSRDTMSGRRKPDRLAVRPRGEEVVRPKLPRLAHVDRAGALAAAIDTLSGMESPPRFPSGRDNLQSLALVRASILSSERSGAWVEIAEVFA